MSKPPPGFEDRQVPGAEAPASAGATRGQHFRTLIGGRGAAYSLGIGVVATLVVGAAMKNALVATVGPVAVVTLVVAITLVVANRRAESDFFLGFARSHGFTYTPRNELAPLTPLLGAGDRRHCEHYMEGPLAQELPGLRCGLGHYTFEIRHVDRRWGRPRNDWESDIGFFAGGLGSYGRRRRERWESHSFTICVVDLEAGMSLFPGIFLTRRRGILGRLEDGQWLSRDNYRKVELESSKFRERYELYVDRDHDPVSLRELFAPSLVSWLARHPLEPYFEYRAGALVVYVESKVKTAGKLDWMLDAAREITKRITAEIREEPSAQPAPHPGG